MRRIGEGRAFNLFNLPGEIMGSILRKYATPLSMATFLVIGITGLMMFFHVRNSQVGDLHEWFGIAFVVIVLLHLIRNIKSFGLLLRQPRTWVVVVLIAGGGLGAVGASFATAGDSLGNPRAAQAEAIAHLSDAPIAVMAPAMGLTGDEVIARLAQNGAPGATAEMSLNQVAKATHKPAQAMYLLIFPQKGKDKH